MASREAALKEFSREGSKVERERRQGDAEAKARDVRLQRALEEVDKYKQMLQEVKLQVRRRQHPAWARGRLGAGVEGAMLLHVEVRMLTQASYVTRWCRGLMTRHGGKSWRFRSSL